MISYIALGVAMLALAGFVYVLLQLKKIGSGMEQLGSGLTQIGNKFESFSNFVLSKLPQ